MNKREDRQDAYGTPASICFDDVSSSTLISYVLFDINDLIIATSLGVVPNLINLCNSPLCHTLSNAFSRSY